MGGLAVARLQEFAEEVGLDVEVRVTDVESELDFPVGFMGSPTILIEGVDIDPAVRDLEGTGSG